MTWAAPALEEVVVTAQKRVQNLQDVSMPLTAMTAERLKDAGVTDITGLQNYTPSITVGNTFGYANLFMRGLGLNTVFANVDPSVTLYVDGAIISQPSAQLFAFFDLERAEILRGPQGTLYGRNATGGTINLITAKPTPEREGYVRVTTGSDNRFEGEGALGGPLADNLFGRFAFQMQSRDGYGQNIVTGNDINDQNRKAYRGQLLFNVTEDLELLLAMDYGKENDASNGFLYKRVSFPGSTNPAAIASGIGGYAPDARDLASHVDPQNDRDTWAVTATVKWQLADGWSLTNIANYRETELWNVQDLDVSAVVNSSIQQFLFDSEQMSEELQINYDSERLSVVGGFYYFKEDLYHENDIDTIGHGGTFPSGENRVNLHGRGETESHALFWNAIYHLNPVLAIKAGGRYTEDERTVINDFAFHTPGGRVAGYDAADESFEDYTSEFGIEWRPTETVLIYYTYSEGFKAGTGQLGAQSSDIVEPEEITNHEIGLKSSWLDRSLIANVSAYAYEVENAQLDRTLVGGPSGFFTRFENATTQDAMGFELELFWSPTDRLRTSLVANYLDTEFGSYLTADPLNPANVGNPATPVLVNIEGNAARQSPEWSWNLHGAYDIPLASGAMLTLSADVSFKDDHYFTEFNDPVMMQEAYTLVDARLRYTGVDGRWTAELWGKNLTDEEVEAGNYALATGRVIARTLLPPRTWGVTVGYTF